MVRDDEIGGATYEVDHEGSLSGGAEFSENESPSALTSFQDEDFLFHLYRGSELLQDNCVSEAKEELERALGMRPRDVAGQGLLGVVYFRLGMYPRAIEIYEKLIRFVPREVTPRVNVALCYLKTGQLLAAREALEEVIRLVPHHQRAWGYLGLVFERLGDYVKAQASFDRAGQPHMARRMQQLLDERTDQTVPDSSPPERMELRQAAADAQLQLEQDVRSFTSAVAEDGPRSSLGRWMEPGQEVIPVRASRPLPPARVDAPPPDMAPPAPLVVPLVPEVLPAEPAVSPKVAARTVPESPSEHARSVLLALPVEPATLRVSDRILGISAEQGFVVRVASMRSVNVGVGSTRHAAVQRRARGRELEEPLGGAGNPFVLVEGRCQLTLSCHEGELHVVALGGEFLFLREQRLVGFDAGVNQESGRLPSDAAERTPLVQLSGHGRVVMEVTGSLRALAVSAESNLTLRASSVIGWTGRLLPRALAPTEAPGTSQGFLAFSGDGAVFIDIA